MRIAYTGDTTMTFEAVLAIALACPTLPPTLAPIMAGVAQWENPQLDPRAVHRNPNGTDDHGLAMVNDINLGWTGLTNPYDPCANLTAGAKVLFKRYNGNPPDAIAALYAAGVMKRLASRASGVGALPIPAAMPDEPVDLEDRPGERETLTTGD